MLRQVSGFGGVVVMRLPYLGLAHEVAPEIAFDIAQERCCHTPDIPCATDPDGEAADKFRIEVFRPALVVAKKAAAHGVEPGPESQDDERGRDIIFLGLGFVQKGEKASVLAIRIAGPVERRQ